MMWTCCGSNGQRTQTSLMQQTVLACLTAWQLPDWGVHRIRAISGTGTYQASYCQQYTTTPSTTCKRRCRTAETYCWGAISDCTLLLLARWTSFCKKVIIGMQNGTRRPVPACDSNQSECAAEHSIWHACCVVVILPLTCYAFFFILREGLVDEEAADVQ